MVLPDEYDFQIEEGDLLGPEELERMALSGEFD